jgi:hypothetical protein
MEGGFWGFVYTFLLLILLDYGLSGLALCGWASYVDSSNLMP